MMRVDQRRRLATREQAILREVARGAPLGHVLKQIVLVIEEQMPDVRGSILLLDRDGRRVLHGAAPHLDAGYVASINGAEIGPAAGSCGTAMYLREPVVAEDIATDPRWEPYREAALAVGLRACWSTPILGRDASCLGSFAMYHSRPAVPTEDDLALTEAATSLAAIAIERARADEDLRVARARAERMALEQETLRGIATAVAGGATPGQVLANVARAVASLFAARSGAVIRFDGDGAFLAAAYRHDGKLPVEPGARMDIAGTASERVRRTGAPASRLYDAAAGDAVAVNAGADGTGVAAPIVVAGELWGTVAVMLESETSPPEGIERQLAAFAELAGTAIANADAQERLEARALTDSLTGLSNHRAFHERLLAEHASALRHGHELSVAVFDLDGFKQVNDAYGHHAGDVVLQQVARCLEHEVRAGELLARLGGDEFALLLPFSGAVDAEQVADRVRIAVARAPLRHVITLSAGVCDLATAGDASELMRLADGALYWAKEHGRDVVFRYTPDAVPELSARERAQRLARGQALVAVRALARAIDAKDPSTREHSERVARIASRIAEELGWPNERVAAMRAAALVHDVGKIGVPDAILTKPGRLTPDEYADVREHAARGAQIASEALQPDQVEWIRHHHERFGGGGYPDGLHGTEISLGARILALADAWDAMTSERAYQPALGVDAALAEARRCTPSQFCPETVGALERCLGQIP